MTPPSLPGVARRDLEEGVWRLTLEPGVDPQPLLRPLEAAGPLSLFSANRPSLSEIFLAAVAGNRTVTGAVAGGEGR